MNKSAQALGRLARGHPKRFSRRELARRRALMVAINERRRRCLTLPTPSATAAAE